MFMYDKTMIQVDITLARYNRYNATTPWLEVLNMLPTKQFNIICAVSRN